MCCTVQKPAAHRPTDPHTYCTLPPPPPPLFKWSFTKTEAVAARQSHGDKFTICHPRFVLLRWRWGVGTEFDKFKLSVEGNLGFLRTTTHWLFVIQAWLLCLFFKEEILLNPSPPLISKEEKPTEGDFVHTKRKGRGEERRDRSVRQKLKLRCIHATTTTIVLTIFFIFCLLFTHFHAFKVNPSSFFGQSSKFSFVPLAAASASVLLYCNATMGRRGKERRQLFGNWSEVGSRLSIEAQRVEEKVESILLFLLSPSFLFFAAADVTI